MKYKNFIKYWLPVILYIILIFYLSSVQFPILTISSKTGIKLNEITPYIYHVSEFGLLSYLLWRALKNSNFKNPQLCTVIFCIIYAVSDEIHQLYVPSRVFSFLDISSDISGILVVQLGIYYINLYKSNLKEIKKKSKF